MSEPVWPSGAVLEICRWLLRVSAHAVPVARRVEWLAEWEGELWALQQRRASAVPLLRYALAGSVTALREAMEVFAMEGVLLDVRHALRRLRRSPGFSAVAVLVLALGIGANTALFSAARAVLLDGPPYPEADRIVTVDMMLGRRAGAPQDTMPWSYPKFEFAREALTDLQDFSAYWPGTVTLTDPGEATRIGVEFVTPSYFDLLGLRPVLGRVFDAAQEPPSAGTVAVLSHGFWARAFGSDPGVLGRSVTLAGARFEIVGVMPAGFRGVSGSAELWVPVAGLGATHGAARLERHWSHWLRGMARLGPGVTLERARSRAMAVGTRLTEAFPDPSGDGEHGVAVVPFTSARVNPTTRAAVVVVSAGALLLLVIACGNVASLLLARSAARRTEIAVRAALGASGVRLARETALESVLLTGAGGAAGLLLALGAERIIPAAVSRALSTTGTRGLQYFDAEALSVDAGVLAAGLGLVIAIGLLFGVVPARIGVRPDLTRDLRAGGRDVGAKRRDASAVGRSALVVAQLALTLMLLAGAGLMAASYAGLSDLDPGFSHEQVLALRFERGSAQEPDRDRAFEAELLRRVSSLPGVSRAAIAPCAPLQGECEVVGLRQIDDQPPVDFGDMQGILLYAVSPSYFETVGVAIREGRGFGGSDAPGAPPVALISETAARELFAGESAIGHRIAVTHSLTEDRMAEIVGVVADVRYGDLEQPPIPAAYFSRTQAPSSYGTLLVEASGDAAEMTSAVRTELAALDPDLPIYDVATLAELKADATARTRTVLGLLASFAATGLLLAAIGLYGVVSFAVVRRTREMGLRVALGAARRDVTKLVMAPPVLLAGAGAVLGLVGAAALTRFLETLLYGVEPADARVLAAAAAVLLAVAVLAAWLPARRATRLDPATSLRAD